MHIRSVGASPIITQHGMKNSGHPIALHKMSGNNYQYIWISLTSWINTKKVIRIYSIYNLFEILL